MSTHTFDSSPCLNIGQDFCSPGTRKDKSIREENTKALTNKIDETGFMHDGIMTRAVDSREDVKMINGQGDDIRL